MIIMFDKLLQNITLSILILLSSSYGLALESIDNAPIVQPGAPGQPTRDLDAKTAPLSSLALQASLHEILTLKLL